MAISLTGMRSVKVATFDISAHHPMQSFVRDAITGQWYVAQLNGTTDGVENLYIYRCSPDGQVLDKANLVKAGHGNSITIEHDGGSVYLWFRWTGINKPVRWRYSGTVAGKTITSSHADVTQYTSLEPSNTSTAYYSIDEQAGRIASYRGQADGAHYLELRNLADYKAGAGSALHTIDITDYGIMQGFATVGDQVLVYRGAGYTSTDQHPPEIRVYSWTTGAETGRLDVSGASGVNPGDASINEAEGIYVTPEGTILHGLATGLMGTNVSTVYRLTSQSETVGEVGRATLVLDLQEVTGEPMGDASVQVSYDRTVRYKSGGVVPALPEKFIPLAERDRVQVVASDDPDLHDDSRHFRIVVSVQRGYPDGVKKYYAMVGQANDATVNLSQVLSNASPIPAQYANADEFRQAAEDARDAAQSAAADTVALVQDDITAASSAAVSAAGAAAASAQSAADAAALADAVPDEVTATVVAAPDSQTRGALDGVITERMAMAPAPTGTSDDRSLMQGFLDAHPGRALLLPQGATYNINGTLTPPTAGAAIDGQGNASFVQVASGFVPIFDVNNVDSFIIKDTRASGKPGTYIESTTVYPAAFVRARGASKNVKVTDCDIKGFAGAAVYATGVQGVSVSGCTIVGVGSGGGADAYAFTAGVSKDNAGVIIDGGCSQVWIERNGISRTAQGVLGGNANDTVHVRGNTIHDVGGQHGVYLNTGTNYELSGNIITNVAGAGLKVQTQSGQPDATGIALSGNIVDGAGANGIILTCQDNTIPSRLRDVAVTGNVLRNITNDGIVFEYVAGGVAVGNRINGARTGIRLADFADVGVYENRLRDTKWQGILAQSLDFNSSGFTIHKNSIANPAQAGSPASHFGIQLTEAGGFSVSDGWVSGNEIYDTTGKTRYLIYVALADMSTVGFKDNVGSGATDYGYRGPTGAAKDFTRNDLSGNLGRLFNRPANGTPGYPGRDAYGTAAPTTGSWQQGDRLWNFPPSSGQDVGWVCTVSGTPGTWKSIGSIA